MGPHDRRLLKLIAMTTTFIAVVLAAWLVLLLVGFLTQR